MSLINEMLTDLERRRGGRKLDTERALDGVQVVAAPRIQSGSGWWRFAIAIPVGVAAAVIAWYGLERYHGLNGHLHQVQARHLSDLSHPKEAAGESRAQVAATGQSPKADSIVETPIALSEPVEFLLETPQPQARILEHKETPVAQATNEATDSEVPAVAAALPDDIDNTRSNTAEPPDSERMELTADTVAENKPVAAVTPVSSDNQLDVPAQALSGTVEKAPVREPSTPEEQFAVLLQEVRDLNHAQASLRFSAYLLDYPDHAEARDAYARVLLRAGDLEQAQTVLRAGLANNPGHAMLAMTLAHIHVNAGDVEAALAVLAEARPDPAQTADHAAFIAALEQRQGRHQAAIAHYRKALAVRDGNGTWWIGLGISLAANDSTGEASRAYQQALDDRRLSARLRRFAMSELERLTGRS